ncbi:MAG: ABC transporter substrate-binding protein [Actinomycetota bacterium]|nr:ABC transporter substrate-binding protein [Actinomycetota bacterium]
MTYRRILALALGLVLLLAAACAGDDEGNGNGSAGATGGEDCDQIEEMRVGHPGLPPDFIQMMLPLAIELGYMRDNCLEVEIIDFESGVAAFRAMAAGEFDMGLSGSVSPILAFGEGAEAVGIAAGGALTDFQTVATGDIETCEDLRGRSVATDGPGGLVHAVTEQYMASCGIDIDEDVELIVGEPESFVARIAQGEIEATTMHIDERIFAEQELDTELTILANAWEDVPLFHYTTWSTARPLLDDPEKRDQFVRFIEALLKVGEWLADDANRDEAIERMAVVSENPESVIEEAYSTFGSRFPTTCDEMMPMESYEFLIDLQVELGNLEEAFPATELIDTSVCEEAEELLAEEGG